MSTSTRKPVMRPSRKPSAAMPAFVPTTALAKGLDFDDAMMHVRFTDGRVLSVPLVWFPTLQRATAKELARYEIGGGGVSLHWPDLDEDLSIAGLMAGVDRRSA